MRIYFLIAVPILAIGLMITFTGTALADNPPHDGDFTATTDACGGCHRVHRAQGLNLLKVATETDLCFSCHGIGALGATTNVEGGALEDTSGGSIGGGAAGALRGGGFVSAYMDPTVSNNWAVANTTSAHEIDTPGGVVWGNGPVNAAEDPGASGAELKCTSCHNPHGFAGYDQYRVLRPIPHIQATGFETPTVPIMLVDQSSPKSYIPQIETRTIAGATAYYRQAADTPTNISNWCSQCHTRYMASAPDDTTPSGDAIFRYRHNVDKDGSYGPRCLECHLAHGTTAAMGAISSLVEDPSQHPIGSNPNPTGSSSLLTTDNRGVCVRCHNQESRHPFPNPP